MTLSFKVLTEESFSEIKAEITEKLSSVDIEDIEGIFSELFENISDDIEYALSAHAGCMLIRIYDGEYLFSYPIALEDGACELLALDEIRRYAVKEEIPLVISDIPRERLGEAVSMFRHASIDVADADGDYYTLRPVSEISLISKIPSQSIGKIELTSLRPEDEEKYAFLCRDAESNRFWGYDFREDAPYADDSYFMETAEAEFNRGVAISFAVRHCDIFVGEAILYAFDLKGGAQCAIRILPEYRRRGYAKASLSLLSTISAQLGLVYLCGTVDSDNIPSKLMFESLFDSYITENKNIIFTKKL